MNSTRSTVLLVLGASLISFTGGYFVPRNVNAKPSQAISAETPRPQAMKKVEKFSFREIRGENLILKFTLSRRPFSEIKLVGWGLDDTDENSMNEIVVDVSGRYQETKGNWTKLYVDASIFANLFNIRWDSVEVKEDGRTATMKFSGADAGNGYDAELKIKDGLFLSKKILDGEFPDNFKEECVFTSIPYED